MWWMLVIPIVVIITLYYLYPEKTAWWEYMLCVIITTISISTLDKFCDYAMASDTEYHGGWVVNCVWDEHWTETYIDTETYTDSDGKSQTRLVTKTRYHPDEYHVEDSNGYSVSVDQERFDHLSRVFGNNKKDKPWRSGQSSWGDGRRFTTIWPGYQNTFIPCFTSHRYRNKIARSNSVFNFKKVSKQDIKKYGLFQYPEIYNYYYQNSLLGWEDFNAEQQLTIANAKLGAIKQVRIFILVFRNQPIEAGFKQQSLWKNGNKNEVVICIGTDQNRNITWVHPFAWDNERLLVDLREDIAELKNLDASKIVDQTISLVEKQFRRKHFKDFEYIRLQPPGWAVFLCFLTILLINGGTVLYVISNDIDA